MTDICTSLEEEGKKNATINRFISAVSMVLKYCKENDVITFDLPTPFKRRKERDRTNRKYYTKEQVKDMLRISKDVMCNDNLADLIQAGALTGMRLDELLKLPVWRVDLNLNVINVEHTKNEEPRCIPIHPQLMNTLIARCEGNPKDKVFGVDWNNADQVRWQFKNLLHRHMGFPDNGQYVFHCLRHSFATWHLANGTPPIELMSMLGHKNLTTTLLYAKATAAGQRKAQDDLQF
jgi:integrase